MQITGTDFECMKYALLYCRVAPGVWKDKVVPLSMQCKKLNLMLDSRLVIFD